MNIFVKKNKNKKFIILDIPLLLENKIYKKNDILVFVWSKKQDIQKRLIKRLHYNSLLINRFRNLQLSLAVKRRKSHFILRNNFTKKTINQGINNILKIIIK